MLGDENSSAGPILELLRVESGSAHMKEQGLLAWGCTPAPGSAAGTGGCSLTQPHLLLSWPHSHKGPALMAVSLSLDNYLTCLARSMCSDFPADQPDRILLVSFLLQAADAKGLWLGPISPCVLC